MTFHTVNTLGACGFFDQQARHLGLIPAAIAAAGTTQGDAAAITATFITATGAANAGLKLPANPKQGDTWLVVNNDANTIKVYPPSGGAINAAADDAAVTIATELARLFVCYVGGSTPKYVSFVAA